MSSELMKKISGQLTDVNGKPLSSLPFGITIEMTTTSGNTSPGGWIGAAPVKASGYFELLTAYNIGTSERVSYQLLKDGQPVTSGDVLVANFNTVINLSENGEEELHTACDCGCDDASAEQPTLSGYITNQNGKPVSGGLVNIYTVALRAQNLVKTVSTDSNGYYECTFARDTTQGVQISVKSDATTAPETSDVFFSGTNPMEIDFTLSAANTGGVSSEYQLLKDVVNGAIYPETFDTLQLTDASYLAGATGENEALIRMLLLAHAFSAQVYANEECLYGIIRTSRQESLEVIVNYSTDELYSYLQLARAQNIITHFADTFLSGAAADIKKGAAQLIMGTADKPVEESKGIRILSIVLSGANLQQFLEYFYSNDTASPDFWDGNAIRVKAPGMDDALIEKVKSVLTYALIAGNNPAIVKSMMNSTLSENVSKTADDWADVIAAHLSDADFSFPDYITGDDIVTKIPQYAAVLKDNVNAVFKGTSIVNAITNDDTFPALKANIAQITADLPGFDVINTPSIQLSQYGVAQEVIDEVASIQRLHAIAPSYDVVAVMKQNSLSSATDIISLSADEFVSKCGAAFKTTDDANIAYNNALSMSMTAQAIAANLFSMASLPLPSIYATQGNDSASSSSSSNFMVMSLMATSAATNTDWSSQFGSADFCTCTDCASVFSPSAYLVDSLELLRKNNTAAYKELRARRPDLWNTELSCKNTNTALPYIDLVNEILEDMMKASKHDINTTTHTGDQQAYYDINGSGLRNTTLDEKKLNAIPEYVNNDASTGAPYQTLLTAKYPWKAPYNYFHEQGKEYLNLVDIAPYQLPKVFSGNSAAHNLDDTDAACAYLDITKPGTGGEYAIITDNGSAGNVRGYYGLNGVTIVDPANRSNAINVPSSGSVANVMNRVDILMQQSGLSMNDVLELLDCYYINPVSSGTNRELYITASPVTSCKTSDMRITGLTENHLLAMHRFVRLQRKTGWSKYEFDQVLNTLQVPAKGIFTEAHVKAVAQLKRLTEILECAVTDILPFWGDFGYKAYSSYNGSQPKQLTTQYESLFRNPTVVANQNSYLFPADMIGNWKNSNSPLAAITSAQQNAVLAALKLPGTDFKVIVDFFTTSTSLQSVFTIDTTTNTIQFSYNNVLALFRETTFARLLKINMHEWCLLRSWMKAIGINPFGANAGMTSVLSFIENVRRIRNSGFSADMLNYLFADRMVSVADKADKYKTLQTRYTELRTLLQKLNTTVTDASGNVDEKALQAKLSLVLAADDVAFVIDYIGKKKGRCYGHFFHER